MDRPASFPESRKSEGMLELRTLGGLALVRDGAPCPRAGIQRRQLALLAVLAAAGPGGMARDRLAALLWSERDAERGRRLVDQALYAARRECGPHVIVATSTGVALDLAVLGSDLAAFTAALAARDLAGGGGTLRWPVPRRADHPRRARLRALGRRRARPASPDCTSRRSRGSRAWRACAATRPTRCTGGGGSSTPRRCRGAPRAG
jgi:hypothetical protein